jgi:hypothetical protein
MVVLMAMRGCEMDPLFAGPLVVGHMPVLVCMDQAIMMVFCWHHSNSSGFFPDTFTLR